MRNIGIQGTAGSALTKGNISKVPYPATCWIVKAFEVIGRCNFWIAGFALHCFEIYINAISAATGLVNA